MTTTDIISLFAVFGLWSTAAFLALSETSLTSMSRMRALSLQEEGRRGSKALVRLVEHPDRFLSPLLLMVLLCHLVAATLLGVVVEKLGGTILTLATIGQVIYVFLFAESIPKTWAIQHTDRAALIAAPVISTITSFAPLRLLARGLVAFVKLVLRTKETNTTTVSEQELLASAAVAAEEGVIEHEERALIRSIIEFGDTVAREVMVPRPDMVAVEGRDNLGDVLEVAIQAGYSRIPVYEQGIDDIVGIVYTKDLVRALQDDDESPRAARDLVRKAEFVPEGKRVAELMRAMQKDKFHMAIVVDEYGGTAGLVTLEDLIEELVGEIVDEFDVEEPSIEALANGAYRVNARMPLDEVNELLHADFPEGDWDTIGGFVFNLLGHVPTEGEAVEHDGYRLCAEKVQGRRIGRVRIVKAPAAADGG